MFYSTCSAEAVAGEGVLQTNLSVFNSLALHVSVCCLTPKQQRNYTIMSLSTIPQTCVYNTNFVWSSLLLELKILKCARVFQGNFKYSSDIYSISHFQEVRKVSAPKSAWFEHSLLNRRLKTFN